MDGVYVMARGGRAVFTVDHNQFVNRLEVLMHHVDRGTRKATTAAAEEILEESLKQVPSATNTLASSAYYEILGKYRNFEAVIGYGGNGDPVNPVTGRRASEYMLPVHEDLDAVHLTGKAKFLEDPIREYQHRLAPNAARFIRREAGM